LLGLASTLDQEHLDTGFGDADAHRGSEQASAMSNL
jgi:hypothetical protein